jgi:hypothetical protein
LDLDFKTFFGLVQLVYDLNIDELALKLMNQQWPTTANMNHLRTYPDQLRTTPDHNSDSTTSDLHQQFLSLPKNKQKMQTC